MLAGASGGTVAPGPIVGPGVTAGVARAPDPDEPGPGVAPAAPVPPGRNVAGGPTTDVGAGPVVGAGASAAPRQAAWSTATPPPKARASSRTTPRSRPGPGLMLPSAAAHCRASSRRVGTGSDSLRATGRSSGPGWNGATMWLRPPRADRVGEPAIGPAVVPDPREPATGLVGRPRDPSVACPNVSRAGLQGGPIPHSVAGRRRLFAPRKARKSIREPASVAAVVPSCSRTRTKGAPP